MRCALHVSRVSKKLRSGNLVGAMVQAGFICFFSLLVKKKPIKIRGFPDDMALSGGFGDDMPLWDLLLFGS